MRFDLSERDDRTAAAAIKVLAEIAAEMGHRGPPEPEKIWRAHPAGTCRMGFDETDGVVDRDGKVCGTENLFVSGCAVFPTSGTSNPTLTVVQMTQRLAEHLLSRFGG